MDRPLDYGFAAKSLMPKYIFASRELICKSETRWVRLDMDWDKLYDELGEKAHGKTAPKRAAELPPVDKSLSLVEQAQNLTQESLDAARRIMNDVTQPASSQLAAAVFIKEIGHGKATSDVPRMAEKAAKDDVAAKVLALLTDAQLEELRANE